MLVGGDAIMADNGLKEKVRDALKRGYFRDESDFVDVSDGYEDNVHIVVVSRKFEGKRLKEKQDLIWSELQQSSPGGLGPGDTLGRSEPGRDQIDLIRQAGCPLRFQGVSRG